MAQKHREFKASALATKNAAMGGIIGVFTSAALSDGSGFSDALREFYTTFYSFDLGSVGASVGNLFVELFASFDPISAGSMGLIGAAIGFFSYYLAPLGRGLLTAPMKWPERLFVRPPLAILSGLMALNIFGNEGIFKDLYDITQNFSGPEGLILTAGMLGGFIFSSQVLKLAILPLSLLINGAFSALRAITNPAHIGTLKDNFLRAGKKEVFQMGGALVSALSIGAMISLVMGVSLNMLGIDASAALPDLANAEGISEAIWEIVMTPVKFVTYFAPIAAEGILYFFTDGSPFDRYVAEPIGNVLNFLGVENDLSVGQKWGIALSFVAALFGGAEISSRINKRNGLGKWENTQFEYVPIRGAPMLQP